MTNAAPTGEIRDTPLAQALGERYLSYALSTIKSRSLPDVRDGLKAGAPAAALRHAPAQARPRVGYKKCARVWRRHRPSIIRTATSRSL